MVRRLIAVCSVGCIACWILCLPSLAQERRRTWRVYFEEAEKDWAPDSTLRQFADSASGYDIRQISVVGYASPSGRHPFNVALSSRRAAVVADSLKKMFPGRVISAHGNAEDWETLAAQLDRSSLSLEEQDKVKWIARSFPTSDRKGKLLRLDNGRNIYDALFNEVFPQLRRVDIVVDFVEVKHGIVPIEAQIIVSDSLRANKDSLRVDKVNLYSPTSHTERSRRYIFALRSNALVPLTNIGIIVPVGKHFSIGGDWYSPWFWHDRGNRWCFEFQAADVELRYWFRPEVVKGWKGNSLTGHSIGLGIFAGHYDFEKNYHGFQGEAYGGYVDYTYSLSLASHFRLEFSLGLGFARLPWREYQVHSNGGRLLRPLPVTEHYRNWFGPVKAGVSAVIPII